MSEINKSELEEECRDLREELQRSHEILDRVGTDSRVPADCTEEGQRLPARISRFCIEVLNRLLGGGTRER